MDHPYNPREELALAEFRKDRVDLTDQEMKIGRGIRDVVIAELEGLSGRPGFPVLLASKSFCAGSFGRRTHCQPLNDIDLYIVMNAGGGVMSPDTSPVYLEGVSPTPLVDDASLREGRWISSRLVLQRFVSYLSDLAVVRELRAAVGTNDKGRSGYIRTGGLNIDVTPVLLATGFATSIDRYYMPDGPHSVLWRATNPREDQRRLTQLNVQQGGLALPAIRMLKWWNEHRNEGRLKGIHLEVMAEFAFSMYALDGIAQALHVGFVSLANQLDHHCPDPNRLGSDLDANLQPAERAASKRALEQAHGYAVSAGFRIAAGDVDGAIAEWRRIFPGL